MCITVVCVGSLTNSSPLALANTRLGLEFLCSVSVTLTTVDLSTPLHYFVRHPPPDQIPGIKYAPLSLFA